jgi:hypothetical protein
MMDLNEFDKQILVGDNKVYIDENNIIHVLITGDVNNTTANLANKALLDLIGEVEGNVNIFVDINEAGTHTRGARIIGEKALDNRRIGKIALFGLSPVARVLASFFIGFSKKKDMQFFNTKEEAFEWLKK